MAEMCVFLLLLLLLLLLFYFYCCNDYIAKINTRLLNVIPLSVSDFFTDSIEPHVKCSHLF